MQVTGYSAFKDIQRFGVDLWQKRDLLKALTKRQIKEAYFGSAFGLAWAFVEPAVYMLVMAFVLSNKLNNKPTDGYPMFPWLMSGMVVWTFFSSALASGARTFSIFSYLLKKGNFNLSTLPLVNIGASTFVHLIFLGLMVVIMAFAGVPFSFYWFQFLYYYLALCVFLIGLTWLTASLTLFLRDVVNIISVSLQLGFWVSPIFWNISGFPEKYHFLIKLNPMFYIIDGYRRSFLYHTPFWEDAFGTIYFWGVSLIILIVGARVYSKLRPQFGDVI